MYEPEGSRELAALSQRLHVLERSLAATEQRIARRGNARNDGADLFEESCELRLMTEQATLLLVDMQNRFARGGDWRQPVTELEETLAHIGLRVQRLGGAVAHGAARAPEQAVAG